LFSPLDGGVVFGIIHGMEIIRSLDFPLYGHTRGFYEVTPFELLISGFCDIREYIYAETCKILNGNKARILVDDWIFTHKPRTHSSKFDIAVLTPFSMYSSDFPLRECDTGRLFHWGIVASRYESKFEVFKIQPPCGFQYPPHASTAQELVMKMDLMSHPLPDKVRKIAKLA